MADAAMKKTGSIPRDAFFVMDDVDGFLDRQDEISALRAALVHLSPRQERVVRSVMLEGRSQKEVADELGVSTTRLGQLLTQGLKRLRKKLLPHPAVAARARAAFARERAEADRRRAEMEADRAERHARWAAESEAREAARWESAIVRQQRWVAENLRTSDYLPTGGVVVYVLKDAKYSVEEGEYRGRLLLFDKGQVWRLPLAPAAKGAALGVFQIIDDTIADG